MEYLVTMTTHVPDGTGDEVVDDMRARESARAHELALERRMLRLWRLPGERRALGHWQAPDSERLGGILASLPLAPWWTVEIIPLSRHPSDPATSSIAR